MKKAESAEAQGVRARVPLLLACQCPFGLIDYTDDHEDEPCKSYSLPDN